MAAIQNDRDTALQASVYRLSETDGTITSSAGAFVTSKNGGATSPASITLTASTNLVFTGAAVKTWHYSLNTSPDTWVLIGTGNSRNITNTDVLAIVGNATTIIYRCTITENLLETAYDYYSVSYIKEPSDPIVVDISRPSAVIAITSAGAPVSLANTDVVITATRGTALAYAAAPGTPNSFTVSDNVSAGITAGAASNTATSYTRANLTGITSDFATITFTVTIYNAQGVAEPITQTRQIVYTRVQNGAVGSDVTVYYIDTTAPVVYKSTSGAIIAGSHSSFTATAKKVVGSAFPVNEGFLTVTGNGEVEATTAVNSITKTPNNGDGQTSYTVKLYNQATVSGATLIDTEVIPVVFTGSDAITAVLTNDSSTIPVNSSGTAGVYTSSGTNIYVFQGSSELTYDGVGTTAGTWRVLSTAVSGITVGAITDGGTFAIVAAASNMTTDTASIDYTITGTTAGGNPFTLIKRQTFAKSYAGSLGPTGATGNSVYTATVYRQIASTTAPVATASTYNFSTGVLTPPTDWTVTQPSVTTVNTWAVDYTFVGAPTATVTGTGSWTNLRVDAVAGAPGSNGTGGTSINTVELYQQLGSVPAVPTGTSYDFSTDILTGTLGSWTRSMPASTTTPTYLTTCTFTVVAPTTTQARSVWTTPVIVAQNGTNGTSGTKSITINAYKWSNTGIGTFTQAFTYTWSSGNVSAYPSGWTASAPAATGSGYTLYQISLTITAPAGDLTSSVNWSSAVSNTIGYRQDGSIGPQGNSHRTAYVVTLSATVPGAVTPGTGDVVPTSAAGTWSFSATSILSAGQYMYQVDGIYTAGGNIAWGNPYLSNLKVGSLSAITADLGVVGISSTGSLSSTGKTYEGATGGFFLGYSGAAYKFDIGNSTNYMRWDGSSLIATGMVIKNTAGTTIIDTSGNPPAGWLNSNVTVASLDNTIVRSANPINSGNVTTYIAAAAIGNTQIGGTIQSNDYVAGTSGWAINKGGAAEFSNATFRGTLSAASGSFVGSVNTGAFTGYAWPTAGGTGAHISSLGLLLGNPNVSAGNPGGKYFQVSTPVGGVPVINTNIPAYLEDLQVNTLKIANEAVSVTNSATGTAATVSTTIVVPANLTMKVIGLAFINSGSTVATTLIVDGVTTTGTPGSIPIITGEGGPDGTLTVSGYTNSTISIMNMLEIAGGVGGKTVTVSATGSAGINKVITAIGTLK